MPVLSVKSISKQFGARTVVNNVSFGVKAGELLALIGPNGAGKTTIFNMIHGQLEPSAGKVVLNDINITGMSPIKVAHMGVGRTFQVAATFASMTVLENVQTALLAHKKNSFNFFKKGLIQYKDQAMQLLEQVGMQEQSGRISNELAYGDVKRVEFAMALASSPQVLLMDEPTAGMAPSERQALMELVAGAAKNNNIAVLFTEHSMDVVFGHANKIIVLANGSIVEQGNAEAIKTSLKVQEVYFGGNKTLKKSNLKRPEPYTEHATGIQLLNVSKLNSWYGAAQVLFDVNLTVGQGEVIAVLGRNGAGKSTMLKSLMGEIQKRSGKIDFMGNSILQLPTYKIAKMGLGYVPQERRIFTDLSVLENLRTGKQLPRVWENGSDAPSWSIQNMFEHFPNLAQAANRLGDQLSGGEQQMLSVARTLMGNPYLVLLDEPSEGVAPIIIEALIKIINLLKQRGVSVVLAEQNIEFAAQVADRAYILEKGAVRYEDSMYKLLQNQQTRQQMFQ